MTPSLIGTTMLCISLLGAGLVENQMIVLIGAIWGAAIIIDSAIRDSRGEI